MAILDNSTRELGNLKDKLEPLVGFFQKMLEEIQENVEGGLQGFLRPIENGITVGKTPEEVEAVNVSLKSKKVRLISDAHVRLGMNPAANDWHPVHYRE